jgi:hypothetical protein
LEQQALFTESGCGTVCVISYRRMSAVKQYDFKHRYKEDIENRYKDLTTEAQDNKISWFKTS